MAWDTNSKRFSGGNRALRPVEGRDDWGEIAEDAEPFDPAPWLAFPRVVLFGSNHFASRLPVGTTLVWLKKNDAQLGTFLSDAETAWMKGGHGVYCFRKLFPPPTRMYENAGAVAHPTQKPVALMRWRIGRAKVPAGGLILDPYSGSGTTALAAMLSGHRCILIEKDARHCDTIRRRVGRAAVAEAQSLFASVGAE